MIVVYKLKRKTGVLPAAALLCVLCGINTVDGAQAGSTQHIKELEKQLQKLEKQVEELKQQQVRRRTQETETKKVNMKNTLATEDAMNLNSPAVQKVLDADSWVQRFTLGGYGEMHANFNEGSDADRFDIHRLVGYINYEFADWMRFHSEVELEHAYASDGKGGKVLIEQACIDFLLSQPFNIRIGRVLTPLGIINKWHEPNTFNGVERPSFAKYILPTTWGSDGIGAFGSLTHNLKYEAYLVNGLDGSGFSAEEGLRDGRMHERPGLNEPAVAGRIDYRPLDLLRLGISGYVGGLDNKNKGGSSDIDGYVRILSADFELTVEDFALRGVVAHNKIHDGAGLPAGVGEEMFGWYLEGAYHFWPEIFKRGILLQSDAVVFVRYDRYDTQYKMSGGVPADERFDRSDITAGLTFKPVSQFAVKADYQFREHEGGGKPGDTFNLGVGWEF